MKQSTSHRKPKHVAVSGVHKWVNISLSVIFTSILAVLGFNVVHANQSESSDKNNANQQVLAETIATKPEASTPQPIETVDQPQATQEPAPEPVVDPDEVTHTVAAGETLDMISTQYFGDASGVLSIVQQNHLASANAIEVGQVLHFNKNFEVLPVDLPEEIPAPAEEVEVPVAQEEPVAQAEVEQPPVSGGLSDVLAQGKVAAGGLSNAEREYVLSQLVARTGVDAGTWNYIISRESGWVPNVVNSLGYYGLFQLAPGYQGHGGSVDEQINGAVYLFQNGGMAHWAL